MTDPPPAGGGDDRQRVAAIRRVGADLLRGGAGWRWHATRAVPADFNRRLGGFLDALGVEHVHHPAVDATGTEAWLLTGRIGNLAVRCEVRVQPGIEPDARVLAVACVDSGAALQCARVWAVDAARGFLVASAQRALDNLHHIPFHEHDAACMRLADATERLLAACAAAPADAAALHAASAAQHTA